MFPTIVLSIPEELLCWGVFTRKLTSGPHTLHGDLGWGHLRKITPVLCWNGSFSWDIAGILDVIILPSWCLNLVSSLGSRYILEVHLHVLFYILHLHLGFFFFHLKHMHSFPTVQQFCSKTSQGSRFTKSLISSSLTKKVVSSSRSLGNNIGWSTQNIGREGSMSAEWRICWQRIDFHQLVTIPFDFFFGKVP